MHIPNARHLRKFLIEVVFNLWLQPLYLKKAWYNQPTEERLLSYIIFFSCFFGEGVKKGDVLTHELYLIS